MYFITDHLCLYLYICSLSHRFLKHGRTLKSQDEDFTNDFCHFFLTGFGLAASKSHNISFALFFSDFISGSYYLIFAADEFMMLPVCYATNSVTLDIIQPLTNLSSLTK